MKSSVVYGLVGAAALLGAVMLVTQCNHGTLTDNLPPRISYPTEAEALRGANLRGGLVIGVRPTGSMEPFIPACPVGANPLSVFSAYAVGNFQKSFQDLKKGDLAVYQATWAAGNVMHVAAAKTSSGWIMSGISNAQSEPYWHVTEANFVCIVESVHVWSK